MSTIGLSLYRVCASRLSGFGLRRFRVVNRLNDWVLGRVKGRSAIVDGHIMHLDPCDSLNLSLNQVYEPFETELIRRLVQKGDTVLDVGANIGYYTLMLARQVGAGGRVIAFEPDPDNFALLKKNVESNGYRNVILVNAALSNLPGTLRLYLCDDNKGDHRIYPSDDDRRAIEIPAVAADDYLDDISHDVGFVKIDVQGAEGRVLLGMERILRRSIGCQVIFEFWPQGLCRAGDDPSKVLDFLARLGFQFQLLDEGTKRLSPVRPEDLLKKFTVEKGNQTNLFGSRLHALHSNEISSP